MSKALAFLSAGGGAAAVSVGGFYLFGGSGSSQQSNSTTPQNDGNVVAKVLLSDLSFNTLQDFKTNKGGDCAKYFFKELKYGTEGSVIGLNNVIVGDTDLPTSVSEGVNPSSCLVIN